MKVTITVRNGDQTVEVTRVSDWESQRLGSVAATALYESVVADVRRVLDDTPAKIVAVDLSEPR